MNYDLYSTQFTIVGYIAFWIAAVVIGTFLIVAFISFVSKKEVIRRQMKLLLLCFLVALSIWAFLWDPAPYYDSYKHFQWLDQIRKQNLGLLTFLRDGFQGSSIGNYHGLVAFNILRYVLVNISSNNHIFPFVCAAIDYFIFYYVVVDFFDRQKIKMTWLFVVWTMSFSFMSYFMVVSGIRNALAASVSALAIYNHLYKKHNLVEYFVLSIIAVTIHPNVIFPLLIAYVYPLFSGIKSVFVMILSAIFFRFGYIFLKLSGISFLEYIGEVIEFYLIDNQYYGELTTYIVDIVVILSCLLLLIRNDKTKIGDNTNKLGNENCAQFVFVYCVALLTLAFVGGTNFLTRGCYVLGTLSVFLVGQFSRMRFRWCRQDIPNFILMGGIIIASLVNIGNEFMLLLAQFF